MAVADRVRKYHIPQVSFITLVENNIKIKWSHLMLTGNSNSVTSSSMPMNRLFNKYHVYSIYLDR